MTVHLPLLSDTTTLPTGKNHISFSEVQTALSCGWKHKLKYVERLEESSSEHLVYGSAVHEALEYWLLNKDSVWFDHDQNIEGCMSAIKGAFEDIGFNAGGSTAKMKKEWLSPAQTMLEEVPGWMDATFPGWSMVATEIELFEPIEGKENIWYKGFVDCVIKVPKKVRAGVKNPTIRYTYWILDWKTTSWGWDRRKKTDRIKKMQLSLYKHYIAKKLDIPLTDIKCGFVLLKRTAKVGNQCELVDAGVGPQALADALATVSETVNMIQKKMWMKEIGDECRFCEFFLTPHCNFQKENK